MKSFCKKAEIYTVQSAIIAAAASVYLLIGINEIVCWSYVTWCNISSFVQYLYSLISEATDKEAEKTGDKLQGMQISGDQADSTASVGILFHR